MKKQGKKKNNDWQKTFSKIFIVAILLLCVLGFSLTYSFFSIFNKIDEGEYAIVDYTLSYEKGAPIISSSQSVVQNAYKSGYSVALSNPLKLKAGAVQTENYTGVDAYVYPDGKEKFELLDLELNAISQNIVGMHDGDVKQINLDFANNLTFKMSSIVYNALHNDSDAFDNAEVGMLVPLEFYPKGNSTTNTSEAIQRPAVIVNKTNNSLVFRYGYAVADIEISEIQ
ncbi:hypothetical protein J2128_000769 [Methanomicrobium sp. W14]|uniref:hypothetical protein n=1 Tax=Methanomicrobium sp. W14 TaxID=2817839 RepID=UPI001AE72A58|nr:hypothetical protein [Methanomicrobium sp. W14]MBP2132848.1 hypothetical protein [Methanomicrobium sp. W14]